MFFRVWFPLRWSQYLAILTGDILWLSYTTFILTRWIFFCSIRDPWCTPKQHPVEHLRQLSGSKCWTLLDDSRSNPRAEVTLAPKDVMYLPQGHGGYGGYGVRLSDVCLKDLESLSGLPIFPTSLCGVLVFDSVSCLRLRCLLLIRAPSFTHHLS